MLCHEQASVEYITETNHHTYPRIFKLFENAVRRFLEFNKILLGKLPQRLHEFRNK